MRACLLVWLSVSLLALAGCDDEGVYDPTDGALDGVVSGLRAIDDALTRATDRGLFDRMQEESPVAYDGARWRFGDGAWTMTFAFADAGGAVQWVPTPMTDRMEVTAREAQGLAVVTTSSTASALTTGLPAISLSHAKQYEVGEAGVRVGTKAEIGADVIVLDGCAEGYIWGNVTAWGEAPLQPRGERTVDIEAGFDGRDLVWTATDGSTVLAEGRLLSTSGC
jgi:hypothetical protein